MRLEIHKEHGTRILAIIEAPAAHQIGPRHLYSPRETAVQATIRTSGEAQKDMHPIHRRTVSGARILSQYRFLCPTRIRASILDVHAGGFACPARPDFTLNLQYTQASQKP